MVVKIRTPSRKGDSPQLLPLEEAKEVVSGFLQKGWIASINRKAIKSVSQIQDGDEVKAYPTVSGG